MKVLVFGKSGQVARELAKRIPDDLSATFLDRNESDLSAPMECAERVMQSGANLVINAAAWTDVDKAEQYESEARVVNGDAPTAIAGACEARGIPFLHLSTDYVLGGAGKGPFHTSDVTAPINAYGRSKLAGEVGIQGTEARHVILRTSWLFSKHGSNFVKTMLKLGSERDRISVVSDQFGGPTPASSIAEALFVVARAMGNGHTGGIYHFSGSPQTTWSSFARVIMSAANLECEIQEIRTSHYPTPAARPLDSRLDCASFQKDFGISQPDWRPAVREIVRAFKGIDSTAMF